MTYGGLWDFAATSLMVTEAGGVFRDAWGGERFDTATAIWQRINLLNLHDNILPTRQRADLILRKGESHLVEEVALRRL